MTKTILMNYKLGGLDCNDLIRNPSRNCISDWDDKLRRWARSRNGYYNIEIGDDWFTGRKRTARARQTDVIVNNTAIVKIVSARRNMPPGKLEMHTKEIAKILAETAAKYERGQLKSMRVITIKNIDYGVWNGGKVQTIESFSDRSERIS